MVTEIKLLYIVDPQGKDKDEAFMDTDKDYTYNL